MATPSHTGVSVDRVAVRIPDFYAADPEMWSTIAERNFEAAGITTEHTRYGYILGALPTQYSMEVRDIIMNPPAATPYQKLKTELIRRLSSVLKTLWIGRLPASLQLILATMRDAELDRIAEVADAVSETYHGSAKIAVASTSVGNTYGSGSADTSIHECMSQLREEIASLRREMNRRRPSRRDGDRRRSPRRARSGSASRRRLELRGGKCFYHWKFGSQAHSCTSPCNWHSSGNATGSR
ncbi:uncharacterized protein LOC143430483 [Xylocopa sonorina]|uniref:uncharacterized protein LOC143430483 n=1 Tax=Xylocopa sonorina TaxID=1818115 RepID=UPI00403ACA67